MYMNLPFMFVLCKFSNQIMEMQDVVIIFIRSGYNLNIADQDKENNLTLY